MALIDTQQIKEAGIIPTLTTPGSTSNTFTNSGKEIIMIKNSAAESNTVTITATTTSVDIPAFGDLTKSNASLVVTAGSSGFIGPFPLGSYEGTDSAVTFTLSSISSVEIAILTLES